MSNHKFAIAFDFLSGAPEADALLAALRENYPTAEQPHAGRVRLLYAVRPALELPIAAGLLPDGVNVRAVRCAADLTLALAPVWVIDLIAHHDTLWPPLFNRRSR